MTKKTNSPAVAAKAAKEAAAAARRKTANNVMSALKDVRTDFESANNEFENAATQLYRTLTRIYDQFVVLKEADKETRKLFYQKADNLEVTKTAATTLATTLLRVVAGDKLNAPRLKSYAACFEYTYKNNENNEPFDEFIMSFGGIDYVRRVASESDKKTIDVNATRQRLNAASALMSISQKARKSMFVESSKSSCDEQFYVALVRKDNNEVVRLADSKASVNATIKYVAKKDAAAAKPNNVKTMNAKTGEEVSAEEAAAQLNEAA